MRKVESQMLNAISDLIGKADFDGVYFKSGNTAVSQSRKWGDDDQRIISVRLHGNEIAAIRPAEGTVWISDCGWRTVTTKSRLSCIMQRFTRFHYWLNQEQGEWVKRYPSGVREAWNGNDVFPLHQQYPDDAFPAQHTITERFVAA